jgi:hypothetical protein
MDEKWQNDEEAHNRRVERTTATKECKKEGYQEE